MVTSIILIVVQLDEAPLFPVRSHMHLFKTATFDCHGIMRRRSLLNGDQKTSTHMVLVRNCYVWVYFSHLSYLFFNCATNSSLQNYDRNI